MAAFIVVSARLAPCRIFCGVRPHLVGSAAQVLMTPADSGGPRIPIHLQTMNLGGRNSTLFGRATTQRDFRRGSYRDPSSFPFALCHGPSPRDYAAPRIA